MKRFFMKQAAMAMLVVGVWTASMAPAHAIDFYNLRVADFPAHVGAIVFPSENRIDSSSSTCWGNWCVTFGSEPPVARLSRYDDGRGDLIRIEPLECKNPVEGTSECYLVLQIPHDNAVLQLRNPGGESGMHFKIRFPQDLILE